MDRDMIMTQETKLKWPCGHELMTMETHATKMHSECPYCALKHILALYEDNPVLLDSEEWRSIMVLAKKLSGGIHLMEKNKL